MKFTPKYTVSYHGVIHKANVAFEIDASDAEEMKEHGTVEEKDSDAVRAEKPVEEQQEKKTGRPKKTAE